MATAAMVCNRPGRRIDSVSGFAPESHRCADDLLATATATAVRGYHIFCHVFLPWKRRCVFEPGLATERRPCNPGLYEPIATGDACAMDNRLYCNSCRSAGEHLAHGPVSRAPIAGRHRAAFWTGASAKTVRCPKKRRHSRCACDRVGVGGTRSGDAFGATA